MSNTEYVGEFDEEDEGGGLEFLAMLRDPGGMLRRRVRWMVAVMVVLLLATAAATVLFPMRYEARGTILLTSKSIPDEFVPTTIMANILEQFETIRGEVFSRSNLTTIIMMTGLYERDRESKSMAALASKLGQELVVAPISKRSRSRTAPRSMSFEVTFAAENPDLAANVVNTAIAQLIDANVEYRSRQARVTTEFMQREFDRADEALRAHQRKLAQFRADSRGSLPEEQEATLSKLERLEEQRRSAILSMSDYRARLEHINNRPTSVGSQPTSDSLREQLEHARAVYTDDHPTVKSLERRLLALTQRGADTQSDPLLSQADRDERRLIEDGIRGEQQRLTQIDADTKRLEGLLASAPAIAEDYAALTRNEQILRENYVEYLRKLKNAELALSLESSQHGAQLGRLDAAIPPLKPVIPRWLIAAGGVIVSIGGAIAMGLLLEILFPVIIDQRHLEAAIPVPCLGAISRVA
jgi:protein tyrosine kinase modulator